MFGQFLGADRRPVEAAMREGNHDGKDRGRQDEEEGGEEDGGDAPVPTSRQLCLPALLLRALEARRTKSAAALADVPRRSYRVTAPRRTRTSRPADAVPLADARTATVAWANIVTRLARAPKIMTGEKDACTGCEILS
jgi:hypothetical protein